MKLSIVIPTITGRETLLSHTKAAYIETKPENWEFEFIIARNSGNAGKGWNRGAKAATGDLLHFTADDILPHQGWFETALESAERDEYPAPRLVLDDGSLQGCGGVHGGYIIEELEDGREVPSSQLPFFRTELWELIGPGLPIHYYADNYLSVRAAQAGLTVVYRKGYCFTHVNGTYHDPAMLAVQPEHAKAFWETMEKVA